MEKICNNKHTPTILLRFRDRDDGTPKVSVLVCKECIDKPFFVKLLGVTTQESVPSA